MKNDCKQRKVQKPVIIKHRTKIYTEASYFALKMGVNNTNKEKKQKEEFVNNVIFFKINKRGVVKGLGGRKNSNN